MDQFPEKDMIDSETAIGSSHSIMYQIIIIKYLL